MALFLQFIIITKGNCSNYQRSLLMKHAYINGKIFTSDKYHPYAEAFTVEDGRITWVGYNADLPGIFTDYEIVDLAGKRVLPGFIDAHMHGVMLAEYSRQISCLPPLVHSIEDIVREIARVRKVTGQENWIQGWGYDEGKLDEHRQPTRWDLDRGASDVPVSILRTCGHIRCVNSKALELAGITRDTPDPDGGAIDRDENGEPTGILRENARYLITDIMPTASLDETTDWLVDLGELLLSQGIVAMTDLGNMSDIPVYDYYLKAAKKGLKQEAAIYYFWDFCKNKPDFKLSPEQLDPEARVRVAGIKLLSDGSVSGRTAWMDEPYLGTDECGISVCSDDDLDTAIDFCKKTGCQLSVHSMGGRAIRRIVDRVSNEEPWIRFEDVPSVRMEHITEPTEDSIRKAAKHHIHFVMQPIFIYSEIETYLSNLGAERTKKTYPIRHLLDEGVFVTLSTDAPATSWAVPSDPFPNLKCAVTRQAYDGTDCGKEQAIPIETAVCLYTKNAAKTAGFHDLGMIREGYKADFIVLSDDLLEVPAEDIDKVFVEQTYIDGELVYQK